MYADIGIDFNRFANKENSKEILEEKAFYLVDYLYAYSCKDINFLLEKLISGHLENNSTLNKYSLGSMSGFLICKETVLFYFYLINIELSMYLNKDLREKFMQDMFNCLIFSIWSLEDTDYQSIINHEKNFNDGYRHYDKFAVLVDREWEEKISHHVDTYVDYMTKKFWPKQDCYYIKLTLKGLAFSFLSSVNIKKYLNLK